MLRPRPSEERGTGLIGTLAGVSVVLVLLLFAAQVLVGLYARSAVTAAAYDAARQVAGAQVDHGQPAGLAVAEASAEQRARSVLGRYGSRVSFTWRVDADTVRLHVRATTPHLGIGPLLQALQLDQIDRTVTVRVERVRP